MNYDTKEWVEDSNCGKFSRYATDSESSIWVCNECEEEGVDPYEEGCEGCGAEVE